MRYLLNSAVITSFGTFCYTPMTREEARAWYAEGPVTSTIGYEETAAALGEMLGAKIAVDRKTIRMEPGDEALVFRLVLPAGTNRIDPKDKGAIGRALLNQWFELGLLLRSRG
jgi:hypothetical protein